MIYNKIKYYGHYVKILKNTKRQWCNIEENKKLCLGEYVFKEGKGPWKKKGSEPVC